MRPRTFLSLQGMPVVGRRLIYSALTGAVAGIGAVAFYAVLQLGVHFFLGKLVGYWPSGPAGEPPLFGEGAGVLHRWLFLIVPTLGGLVSGLIVYRFAPEAEGHGTDAAIEAYHHKAGAVRARVPIIKAITSAITLGTGGSGGREGPIAQIGAGFGSFLGERLNLSDRERRILMAAGMGAGVGAIFKSPLAGAIFAGEVFYSEEQLEHEVLVPATVASIIGYSIFCTVFGWGPLFHTPGFHFNRLAEFLPYTVLGLTCAVLGFLYIKCFYSTRDLFHKIPVPDTVKPAIGGLLMGVIGYFFPQAISMGYGILQDGLDGSVIPSIFIGVALLKIVATSLSIGSGGSGGVFGPSVVIGGAIGGAIGLFFQQWIPVTVSEPGAFIIVGMAGFFAGVANTPISTVIMVSEMTGNYNLLVPSMWVCVITFLLLRRWSIYEKQVPNRLHSPAHYGEFVVDALEDLQVRDWMTTNVVSVPESMRAKEIVDYVQRSRHTRFPILNPEGEAIGLLSLRDVIEVAAVSQPIPVIAHDLVSMQPVYIKPEAKLSQVLKLMNEHAVDVLLIGDGDSHRLIGIFTRRDLTTAYQSITETIRDRHEGPSFHATEFERLPVRTILQTEFDAVEENTSLRQLVALQERSSTIDYPVIDANGQVKGMVAYKDFRAAMMEPKAYSLLIVRDLLRPVEMLAPSSTLADALAAFSQYDFDCLPVLEGGQLTGIIRREVLMERYHDLHARHA